MSRAQVSTTTIEAALGLLLLFTIAFTFALGVAEPDTSQQQLDMYADDALTVLGNEPPRHGSATRLTEITASAATFQREKGTLHHRINRILPANLMFQVETAYGTVGYRQPDGVVVGRATRTTRNGPVTLTVWYV